MINLACGMIRISNKCSCLEIFDQQGNLNLTPLVVIPYHLASEPFHLVDLFDQQESFKLDMIDFSCGVI